MCRTYVLAPSINTGNMLVGMLLRMSTASHAHCSGPVDRNAGMPYAILTINMHISREPTQKAYCQCSKVEGPAVCYYVYQTSYCHEQEGSNMFPCNR